MLQTTLVALIVLAAVLYSAWSLMPASWRRGLASRLAQGAQRAGASQAQRERLQSALSSGGGCQECSSCQGCATPARNGVATVAMPQRSIR